MSGAAVAPAGPSLLRFVARLPAFIARPSAHAAPLGWPIGRALAAVALVVALKVVVQVGWMQTVAHAFGADVTRDTSADDTRPLWHLIDLVVFVPLIEEIVFRMPLRWRTGHSSWRLRLEDGVVIALLFGLASGLEVQARGGRVFMLAVILMTKRVVMPPLTWPDWMVLPPWVRDVAVHVSSFAFGAMHVPAWLGGPPEALWLMALALVFGGYALAYVRLRLGLYYAVLTHGLYNLAVVGLATWANNA